MKDVRLELVQGDRTWVLGHGDAGNAGHERLGKIRWRVTIPSDVRAGRPATLKASTAQVRVLVRAG